MKPLHFLQHVLFALLLLPHGLAGQDAKPLALSLRNAETKEPIQEAFVFFAGSSAGGISDAAGEVTLPVEKYLELVISHLNYETKVLSATELENLATSVILLTPRAIKITEVTVSSSAKDANMRKRWLKRFTSAFLGPRRDRRGVRILNPEVLLFQEDGTGLRAEARDRIQIANDALGYEISFLLDTFLLNPEEEVFYGGKAFFSDLQEQQPARAAAWETARQKSFAKSKTRFFRQLVRNELDEQRFDIGQSKFDEDLKFLGFTSKAPSELEWQRGSVADTLFFTDFFSVADQSIVTKWTKKPGNGVVAQEYATTFLRSRSGRFVISPTGLLLNNQEVEEIGFWADQRVARLLPTNYRAEELSEPGVTLMNSYLNALRAHQRAIQQEKVYLHLDKPYYSIRENIWFKAYLLEAGSHRQQTVSKVVHVELIDPQGEIVQALALHRDKTLSGHFKLDSTKRAGLYHLRAYTDYMRNGPPEYFFKHPVPVYDPEAIGDGLLSGRSPLPRQLRTGEGQPFILSVHPEGGVLVGGVENTMVLHLRDTLGNPLELSGQLIDNSEAVVTNWTTSYAGRGLLRFIPEPGEAYWAQVSFAGLSYKVPLPRMQVQGLVLHVNNLRDEDVFVKVSSSPEATAEGAFLIGHVRGEVFCAMETILTDQDMAFPRSQIPTGLACFSLFAADGKLLAERVFFNDFQEQGPELRIEMPSAFFRPRQEVRLKISWLDSLLEASASLSLAVTDKSLIHQDAGKENIGSYLLLNSDVTRPVNLSASDLSSPGQRERFLLDLQLATVGWERFDWNSLMLAKQPAPLFPPQTAEYLAGYVTQKGRPAERAKAEVTLTALHPQPTLLKTVTDSLGNFNFSDLPYLDTVSYILQAARFNPKKFNPDLPVLTSTNRKVDIYPQARKPAALPLNPMRSTSRLPVELLDDWAAVQLRESALDSLYGAGWQIDLAEITVTARKATDSRNLDVFDLNKLDWIAPEKPAYNLLSTLKPGYRFLRDMTRDQLAAEVNNGKGVIIRVPVTITINGLASTFNRFQGLTADLIDYIMITPVSISVTTRNSRRSSTTREPAGIVNVTGNGFHPRRVFPAPDYSVSRPGAERPDLRTTVHWEPSLRLEAGAAAVLSFYAADRATEYEVRIEGVTDAGKPVFKTFTIRVKE